MMIDDLGIGILSWRGDQPLKQSLESYEKGNLFSHFSEKVIFLPEQRELETKLARKYHLSVYGHPDNLGILGGFKALAGKLTSRFILLLEDDCPLIEPPEVVTSHITYAHHLLLHKKADVVRLRHRTSPGQDFAVLKKYDRYFPRPPASPFAHLMAATRRLLRPQKTNRLRAWSIYDPLRPKQTGQGVEAYDAAQDCFFVSSTHLPWTNQSIMLRRDFFLDIILPYAEARITKRRVNGFKNLEIEMNGPFWRQGGFRIAQPPGLFTHARIEDQQTSHDTLRRSSS